MIATTRYMDHVLGCVELSAAERQSVDVTEWSLDDEPDVHPWLSKFFENVER